jgi:MFS family permease
VTPRRVLVLLAAAELLAMAPWFSASAVAPALAARWGLTPSATAWLTIAVQLGFVAGALISATLTLSDRWSARRLVAGSAALAAAATLGVIAAPSAAVAVGLRVVTGAALAGVYPPGMKIVAGWFREGRGIAIGIVVGALTLGTAGPHLVRWVVPADAWPTVLATAAVSALLGGVLVLLVPHDGPYAARAPAFRWDAVPRMLRDRPTLLANAGYLGHMWELYAMWTWVAAWVLASEAARGGAGDDAPALAALVAFGVIGAGAVGCWLAGVAAERWGRTLVTSAAMAVSAACCLLAGLLFGARLTALVPLLLVWGVAIVADSAQFSTAVSELAPSDLVGSALTLQTCLGFLLTTVTIYGLPLVAEAIGWRWAMAALAPGPLLGIAAMLALRRRPEAARLAGGRR